MQLKQSFSPGAHGMQPPSASAQLPAPAWRVLTLWVLQALSSTAAPSARPHSLVSQLPPPGSLKPAPLLQTAVLTGRRQDAPGGLTVAQQAPICRLFRRLRVLTGLPRLAVTGLPRSQLTGLLCLVLTGLPRWLLTGRPWQIWRREAAAAAAAVSR